MTAYCAYSGCEQTVPKEGDLCWGHTPNDDYCQAPADRNSSYPPVNESSFPIVLAVRKRGRINQLIVKNCSVCGGTHRHGAAGTGPGDTTKRTPHCDVPLDERPAEYVIVVTGDADE